MAAKKAVPKGPTMWQRVLPWLLRLLLVGVAAGALLLRQPGDYTTAALLVGVLFVASLWAVK